MILVVRERSKKWLQGFWLKKLEGQSCSFNGEDHGFQLGCVECEICVRKESRDV